MKNNVRLLRIFFRDVDFTNDKENHYHYLFHQISLLLISEISNTYKSKISSLLITFGTKNLWVKYYKEENIPIFHYYRGHGSASVIFDYNLFYLSDFESQKKIILNNACM